MLRPTHVEVDLSAITLNIQSIQDRLGTRSSIMAVVKADAYGHGLLRVAEQAVTSGAAMLGVAIAEEGLALREGGIRDTVVVLGLSAPEAARDIVEHGITQTVCTPGDIRVLDDAARALGKRAYVHVKADTGMNRIGLKTMEQLDAVLDTVDAAQGRVALAGLYTHFAQSQEGDSALEQNGALLRFNSRVRERGYAPLLHAANSGAVLRFPQTYNNIVRPGLLIYGEDPYTDVDFPLTPAMRWLTRIIFIKRVSAGERISYDHTYCFERDSVVATLPIGYGDGYKRMIGNRGHVLVRGRPAPVVGRICMDQTMIDVTDIPGVERFDEVVLLGAQENARITAKQMGEWTGTISYEVMLSILPRMPRVYI